MKIRDTTFSAMHRRWTLFCVFMWAFLGLLCVAAILTPVLLLERINSKIDEYDRTRRRDVRLCNDTELATCGEPQVCMRMDCFKVPRIPTPSCLQGPDTSLDGEECDDGDPFTEGTVCDAGQCLLPPTPAPPTPSPTFEMDTLYPSPYEPVSAPFPSPAETDSPTPSPPPPTIFGPTTAPTTAPPTLIPV